MRGVPAPLESAGKHLVTGSDDTRVMVFTPAGRRVLSVRTAHMLNIFSAHCLSPSLDGGVFVSCGTSRSLPPC